MTDMPRYSDLQELTLLWSDAGLPAAKIRTIVQALERSRKADREAREAELAAKGAARRAGELFASGEIATFDAAMIEAIRLGSWLAPVNAKANSYLGPAVRDALRTECHRVARTYVEQQAGALVELARSKEHASAEAIIRWLQKFGYVASPPQESAEPDATDRRAPATWAG